MTTTTHANDLIAELLADVFTQGAPRHLHSECLMADLDTYSTLECEHCGHASQRVTPYHKGRAYRLVCVCRQCGHPQEM